MRKLLVMCLALIFALLPTATIFAQDDGTAPASPYASCGTLEGEDCDTLLGAWENMEQLTSGKSETTLALDVSNVPGLPMDQIGLELQRSAQFNVDPALVEQLNGLQEMSSDEISAMLSDPAEYSALTAALLAGLDTQQTLRFTFSEELATTISESAGLNVPPELKLDLILKDGIVYLFLDDILGLVPNIPPLLRGWVGIEIKPLIDQALADPDALDAPVGPDALEFVAPGVGLAGVGLAMQAPLNQYADVFRLEDGTAPDGSATTTYQAVMNFVGYFSSPEFRDLLMVAIEQADIAEGATLSEDNVNQIATVLTLLAPVLLRDLNYTLTQVVGTEADNNYVYSTDGKLNWDTTGLFQLIATVQGSDEMAVESPPSISLEGMTVYSDHNSGDQVAAPPGAFVLPVQMIMGIIGGM